MSTKARQVDPAGYLSEKTIVALASPTGGALAVIRVSGDRAGFFLEQLTRKPLQHFEEKKATRCWLYRPDGKRLDDAVVVRYANPRSFSGEDLIEIFIHGSSRIAQQVIDQVCEMGGRIALPGEFSFRAVKNGKLQLTQAEAIREVIEAESDLSLEVALEKLSGTQHEFVLKIRDELMQLVTLAEVGIDFSDQDIDEVSLPRLKERVKQIQGLLKNLGASFDRGKRLNDGIPVVFFGLPNAGKSSFFNALLGEDRSIVSAVAGTTRDVVKEKLNLRSNASGTTLTFRVADTAGVRKSGDQIESEGISRTLNAAKDADVLVVLIDGKKPALDELRGYIQESWAKTKQILFVVSKVDQMSEKERIEVVAGVSSQFSNFGSSLKVLTCSSVTLEGIQEAADALAHQGELLLARKPGEVVLTKLEHVNAVQSALKGLESALQTTDVVLFATEARHAMNALGPLLGETVADDILGKIFSDFCIGK